MYGIATRATAFAVFLLGFAMGLGSESLAGPFQALAQPLAAPGSIAPWQGASAAPPPDATSMSTADAVAAPAGYLAFCSRHPDQCADDSTQPAVIDWTPAVQQQLQAVNLAYNTAIQPMEDSVHYGRFDDWTIPADGYGDCEDTRCQAQGAGRRRPAPARSAHGPGSASGR